MIVFNHFKNDARVLKEAYTLIENGYDVKVFALHDAGMEFHENRKGLEIERIAVTTVSKLFLKKTTNNVVDGNEPVIKRMISHPNTKKPNNLLSSIKGTLRSLALAIYKPMSYFEFSKRVVKKILKEPFDIYHAHDLNTLHPAAKAAQLTKGKLIYDSHELYIERNKPKPASRFYKFVSAQFEQRLIKKADAIITVGDCIANYLKDKYNVALPTVIINAPSRNKINIGGKNLRDELHISNDLKLAIYCGGITFNRGLEKLIESLTLMPNVYLVLMGYGKSTYLSKLQSIAEQYKVNERFSFYGPVAPNEVTAYTASADVGIAPIENVCLSYYFCAPNKIFEYLIGGIPVVASNFPELKKVVEENEIGYTFDPQDITSIANSVTKVFSDKKHYDRMKENTKFAAKKYNWENESKKLLNLYQNLA